MGFEPGTFWFLLQPLNPLGHSSEGGYSLIFFIFDTDVLNLFLDFFDSSQEYLTSKFQYYSMAFQYWFSWLFESIKLLLNKTNKISNFVNEYIKYKQLLEVLRMLFQYTQVRFLNFSEKKYAALFLIFRKCQPWFVLSMFLNFY